MAIGRTQDPEDALFFDGGQVTSIYICRRGCPCVGGRRILFRPAGADPEGEHDAEKDSDGLENWGWLWSRPHGLSVTRFFLKGMLNKSAGSIPCLRRSGFAQAGRSFVVLRYSSVRFAHQRPCALVRGKARLGVHGLGG